MDILVRIIEDKFINKKNEPQQIEPKIELDEETRKNNESKKNIVKIFLGINIFFIVFTICCNGCIVFVKQKLNTVPSYYGICNKYNVKICFIVSSVIALILIALLAFLYPFYNSY
jgi:hypothetical protein